MSYTFLDLALDILTKVNSPLTHQEIWEKAKELELSKKISTSGRTPWQTLGARLYVDVRDNTESKFIKVGKRPTRFFLKSRSNEITDDTVKKIEIEESKPIKQKSKWKERDLHPLLTYFAYANPNFGKGKGILTKTILHEKSQKKGYSEWLYPDVVGCYLPLEDWDTELVELGRMYDNSLIKLYSFELKKSLTRGNYRESYFQAVSNSTWANEGYLVAAEIKQDDDFLSELERLTMAFGIGIIQLDLDDFDASTILFPARQKTNLDWETMNKLCSQNDDFKKFIQDVRIDVDSKRIHKAEYDKVIEDPEDYIKQKIKS